MNGKRSVFAFSVCWVLSCVSCVDSVKACGCSGDPPGDPDCCWCEDGVWVCQCDDGPDCGTCWECVEGCCVSCWCWDDGAPISGQIDAPATCVLCQQVGFGADVNDYDHWVSGWGYQQFPKDTIGSYSWSTSPPVGEWTSEQGFITRDWQAPPCLQTVEIRLQVDDKPDPAYGGCYGHMDRDDPSKLFTTTIQVVLPLGCNEGTKDIDYLWEGDTGDTGCGGNCGMTAPQLNSDNWSAVYNNCQWEPVGRIRAGVLLTVCSTDWQCSSPYPLTEANFAEWVEKFRETAEDPCDPTNTGCYSGGPVDNYCIEMHETQHALDYQSAFYNLPAWLENTDSLDPIPVDCENYPTCGAAAAEFQRRVDEALWEWGHALDIGSPTGGEYRARLAAAECWADFANELCDCVHQKGWSDPTHVCDQ